jgi:hypothetical protein
MGRCLLCSRRPLLQLLPRTARGGPQPRRLRQQRPLRPGLGAVPPLERQPLSTAGFAPRRRAPCQSIPAVARLQCWGAGRGRRHSFSLPGLCSSSNNNNNNKQGGVQEEGSLRCLQLAPSGATLLSTSTSRFSLTRRHQYTCRLRSQWPFRNGSSSFGLQQLQRQEVALGGCVLSSSAH